MKFQSIRGKLQFFLFLIMALLIVSFIFSYVSGLRQKKLDADLIRQQQLVSDIFRDLDLTQNLLEKYMNSGAMEDYKFYNRSYSTLLEKTYDFEKFPRDDDSLRNVIDFRYQIQSYIEEANTAVAYRIDDELTLANNHFVETIKLVLIIKNNFKNVFTVIMRDMEVLQANSSRSNRQNLLLNLLVLGIIIVVCFLIIIILIRSLARPIRELTKAAEQVADGNMDIEPVPVVSEDELKIMTLAFNKMINTIQNQIGQLSHQKELEQKLLKEELSIQKMDSIIKETELKALQSRINPHFLFNTLNMITQMAFLEEAEKTSTILEAMSSMLRYNLETFHKTVCLKDEIQNLEDYLYIQRLRFEDRISFSLRCDDTLSEMHIPCLILQPLVENAINHGLIETLSDGKIDVDIVRSEKRMICSISDNGKGIEYERQKEILKLLEKKQSSDDQNIGMNNVYQRLKLFFHDDMDFHLSSIPGKGTEIRIELPIKENGKLL